MAKNGRYVVGLDIGTTKVACVIARLREGGGIEIVGVGESPSRGLNKGAVVNLEATSESIRAAAEQAESVAGVSVESATIGLAGGHVRSFNSRGVVAVSGKDGTVCREDLRRVLDAAQAVSIPADREIVHVLPQEYVLDDQKGIASPVGMTGTRLEANVHIVTASTTSVQNLVTCVNLAGIAVRNMVLEQLAAADAVLTADEKDLGVALVDLGGGTTDLAIFERGTIGHTAVLPVGGNHFTNDLAVGLRTPIGDAERLKRTHGCALASLVEEDEPIEVPTVGGRKPRLLSRSVLAAILEPRAEEIFSLIRDEIRRAGFDTALNAGVVLTGGGSQLPGMIEIAEQVFDLPVRRGQPEAAGGLCESISNPQYATAVGLALYGSRPLPPERRRARRAAPASLLEKMGGRVRAWFSQVF